MSLIVQIEKRLGDFLLDMNFECDGESTAILGPSGAGKSMTLKCIAGIEKPDRGRIVLNGRVLFDSEKKIDLPPQKRHVGYLFQNYALFENMTVEQNIACGAHEMKDKKMRDQAVAHMIEKMHLDGFETYKPSQLSGGQQQRVALARILVGNPEILMLDEPFSALDSDLRVELMEEVKQQLKGYNKDVLWVTHDRNEAYSMCSKQMHMDQGHLCQQVKTGEDFADLLAMRLSEHKASMLVTVVDRSGSAPGRTGAIMLVGEKGYLTGTIGGGMLEYRCISLAKEDLMHLKGGLRQYRLTKEDAASLGMVCGGDVDVLFTVVKPSDENIQAVEMIQDCLSHYKAGWIVLPLDGEGLIFSETKMTENEHGVACYAKDLGNLNKVYIFGGGHLAQELVPVISHLGFRCVVTDDRPEFSTKALFPQAEEVHTWDFGALENKFEIHEGDYIIAMTRGHMGDLEVEKFALRTPAHYIGVVGSRKKIAAVNEKLREVGFTDEDICRIVTPIGLDIHSDTPAEIAISIAAQLIERRALYRKQKRD